MLHKVEDELPRVREAVQEARKATTNIMDGLRAGNRLSETEVGQVVTPLVESVLRNPDAYFWLESMRHHDSYTYSHAMNCCVLMAAFGRHLGLADGALHDLATGGLLFDIGKTVVPEELLESAQPLTDEEQASCVSTWGMACACTTSLARTM